MNIIQLHLALNHLPIVGILIATILFIWSVLKNSSQTKTVALVLFISCAALSVPVYFSGEPTEHSLERTVQLAESSIEQHEDAAGISIALAVLVGVVAALALFSSRTDRISMYRMAERSLVVLSLACTASFVWTGYLGGHIRHTELMASAANARPGTNSAPGMSDSTSSGQKQAPNERPNQSNGSDADSDD